MSAGKPCQGLLKALRYHQQSIADSYDSLIGNSHHTAVFTIISLMLYWLRIAWAPQRTSFGCVLSAGQLSQLSRQANETPQDLYELHAKAQLPMCPLKKRISFQNWTRWLGEDEYGLPDARVLASAKVPNSYYSSYLVFFMAEIKQYGAAAVVERYLFKLKEGKLLIRFVDGTRPDAKLMLVQNGLGSYSPPHSDWARSGVWPRRTHCRRVRSRVYASVA